MHTFISITGPVATGATTLARRLVELMSWEPLFEANIERTNPFFSRYGADPLNYAFHNQVTFLSRSAESHHHLRDSVQTGKVYIQDFSTFEHTEVYAYVQHRLGLLSNEEYEVLISLTKLIEPLYIYPSVLVYRPLCREQLLQRVHMRGRSSEQSLDISFLDAIRQRFDEWVATWSRSPVIYVDDNLDVFTDTQAVRKLGEIIRERLATACAG